MRTKLVCALSLFGLLLIFSTTTASAQNVDDIGEAVGEFIGQLFFPQPAAPALVAPAMRVDEVAPPAEQEAADGPAVLDMRIDEGVPAEDEVVVEAQAAVMMAAAPIAPDANAIDEQLKLLRAQFIQQYQPLLTTELYFLRKVAHPTKEQGKTLKKAGTTALEDAGQKMADVQGKMMRGQFAVFPGNDAYPDPRKVIREGLTVAVKATLTPEQIATYEKELEGRTASRKRTMVKYLVAKLDSELALTAEQRAKLVESLSDNWQDGWDQTVELVMYGENYLPAIPDHLVVGVLTDTQLKIWQSANRFRGQQVFGVGFIPALTINNGGEWGIDEWDDEADQESGGVSTEQKPADSPPPPQVREP